jgi:Na+-transporting NADH:ubiquinone oxidoreductase subunit NqrA
MLNVPTTRFCRNFGRYQDEAHRVGIIEVTSHGLVVGAFISASKLEHFRRLQKREREVLTTGNLPADLVAAIRQAEYGPAGDF